MLVKSVKLGLSRCVGRAIMAESPRGRERTPCTEALWGPLRAAPKRGPLYGRRCSHTAIWGAAKWDP
eukprot:8724059-Alexandrium_andersonii.AAC.1